MNHIEIIFSLILVAPTANSGGDSCFAVSTDCTADLCLYIFCDIRSRKNTTRIQHET